MCLTIWDDGVYVGICVRVGFREKRDKSKEIAVKDKGVERRGYKLSGIVRER